MSRASRLHTRPLPGEAVAVAIRAPRPVGAGEDPVELRARRLAGRDVTLGGAFDLTDEITASLAPLAPRVAERVRSSSVRDAVDDVRDAVDGLTAVVARLLAEVDARLRTSGLADAEAAAARRALLQLHRRPRLRDIAEADLADGTWAETLVAHVRPHSAPLADLLARAFPPGQTRFAASRSEQVLEPLREVDRAVAALARALDTAGDAPSISGPRDLVAAAEARKDAEARATLLRLGIDPDSAGPAQ